MIRDPYHGALYSSIVRIIRGDTSGSDQFKSPAAERVCLDFPLYFCRSDHRRDFRSLMTMTPWFLATDLPLKFHPEAIRVSADVTPFGVG